MKTVVFESVEGVGGARRRGSGAIQIAGQKEIRAAYEFLEGCRRANQHVDPVERVDGVARLVGRHVVGIRPDSKLEVVRERKDVESVEEIGASRIGRLRDGHTHMVGRGELAQQPTVGNGIVYDNRIPGVGCAVATGPQAS